MSQWSVKAFVFFSLQVTGNTLQVVLATDSQVSFVFFIYGNITWGTANVGFNAGDSLRFFIVPGALTSQTRNIEMGSNVNVSGLYIYRVDQRLVIDPSGKCSRLKFLVLYHAPSQ